MPLFKKRITFEQKHLCVCVCDFYNEKKKSFSFGAWCMRKLSINRVCVTSVQKELEVYLAKTKNS